MKLKRIPITCSLRFTPKPPSRVFGRPHQSCSFFGGPWSGAGAFTRTGTVLPITLAGGCYVPTADGRNMTWKKA